MSLLDCPSDNTSTTTVVKVASPDSWSTAITCDVNTIIYITLLHVLDLIKGNAGVLQDWDALVYNIIAQGKKTHKYYTWEEKK